MSKGILKNNKVRGLTLVDIKTSYKPSVIQRMWTFGQGRQIDEWNKIEFINIFIHVQITAMAKIQRQLSGQIIVFEQQCQDQWTFTSKKKELSSISNTMYHIFWTIRLTFPPQIWEEYGGASYSPNVAYIYIGEILCYLCY